MAYYEDNREKSGLGPFLFVMIVTASVALFFLFTWKRIRGGQEEIADTATPPANEVVETVPTTPEVRGPKVFSSGASTLPPDSPHLSSEALVNEFSARLSAGMFGELGDLFGRENDAQQASRAAGLILRSVGERLGYRPTEEGVREIEVGPEKAVYAITMETRRTIEGHPTPPREMRIESRLSPLEGQSQANGGEWRISRVQVSDSFRQAAISAVKDGVPSLPFAMEGFAQVPGEGGGNSPLAPERNGELAPEGSGVEKPHTAASQFLRSVVDLDYVEARKVVDFEKIQGEKIAALCFVFEEGGFELAEDRPLVLTATSEEASWAVAKVKSKSWGTEAEFGIELAPRKDPQGLPTEEWEVVGLNFSSLLSAYASASDAGEVAFTPLVDSPQGGQSLALFFEYDDAGLHPRAERQLNIVADMLRQDSSKKISVTGHADAVGTEDYNQRLSGSRAKFVREYLLARGVAAAQILTQAAGESLPLRPNLKADGSDDPDGRAHNRRAEMYLDF